MSNNGHPKRVMLITPPYHAGVVESAGRWPNLAFINMAGELLDQGFQVDLYDAMSLFHEWDQIRERIREQKPDYVATTAITASINDCIKLLELAKEEFPDVTTVIGGVHVTFLHEEVMKGSPDAVDVCVIGEGEYTVRELFPAMRDGADLSEVQGIAFWRDGEIVCTPRRPLIRDLDSLKPAWHLVNWDDYPLYFIEDSKVAILSSSRGCIHACSFCSQHKFWNGTYRDRDPHKFVAEIEHLFRMYGVNVFFIADEYPTRDRRRWETILDLLIEKDLGVHILLETCVHDVLRDEEILPRYKEAGVLFIYMGVEATSDEQLAEFKKATRFVDSKKALRLVQDHGMIAESSLILGTPGETPESIEETLKLAYEYDADFMHFLFLAPWPYADMYPELKDHIEVWDYSKYNLVEPVIKPIAMTRDELFQAGLNCYKRYYMQKVPKWAKMQGNELKRRAIIHGMNAIMQHSFLKDHMKGLGAMPKKVLKLMKLIEKPLQKEDAPAQRKCPFLRVFGAR